MFFKLHANSFHGYVTLAIIDTFTGNTQKILLEPKKDLFDDKKLFKINVDSIELDEETPSIAWVDIAIHYKSSKKDVPVCVQKGRLSTGQVYLMPNGRYLIGFYILPYAEKED